MTDYRLATRHGFVGGSCGAIVVLWLNGGSLLDLVLGALVAGVGAVILALMGLW